MHYGNQDNFERLTLLAAALDGLDGCEKLAEYCRHRESGLRKLAFAALGEFLSTAEGWEPARQRQTTLQILDLSRKHAGAHQFLSQPLLSRLIVPTLETWREALPEDSTPTRELALLRHEYDLLAAALRANPEDTLVRRRMIGQHLHDIDYQCHHLHEALLIGEESDLTASIRSARELLDAASNREALAEEVAELAHLEQLFADWQAYKAAPRGTFPEWCDARGRKYGWLATVYYNA